MIDKWGESDWTEDDTGYSRAATKWTYSVAADIGTDRSPERAMVSSLKCFQADMAGMTQHGAVAGYAGAAAETGIGAESAGKSSKPPDPVAVGM
jgi:hypothetical protein